MQKKWLALCLALCLSLCGCTIRPVSGESFALDTFITVTVYDGQQADVDAALARVDECEQHLSAHLDGSDISLVNASGGQPVTVDALTARLVSDALKVGEKTDGALDITLYAVSSLWDYKSENPTMPTQAALAAALAQTGRARVTVKENTIAAEGVKLDLGAVAKGAIGDEAVAVLAARGVRTALLNLGGNIFTVGQKRDGSSWVVAIDSPFQSGEYVGTLSLPGGKAVATSSGAQRYFIKDGVRYHHILDPKTGMPANSGLSSVTVVADDGFTADALSTALFVLGEERARQVLAADFPSVAAVLVRDDGSVCVLGEVEFTQTA